MPEGWITREWPALVIGASFLALGTIYAWLAPPYSKPDEVYHYAYVAYLSSQRALPAISLDQAGQRDRPPVELEAHQPPLYYALVALLASPSGPQVEFQPRRNPHYLATQIGNRNPLVVPPIADAPFPSATPFMIGRYVSLVFGALAVQFTYAALRTFLPIWLAGLATVLMAFNPQFLYIASSLSNDVAGVAFATIGIFVVLYCWRSGPTFRRSVIFGLVVGLGTLTKLGNVALPALFVVVVLAYAWRERQARYLLYAVVSGSVVVAVDGLWFLRNVRHYGDPFAVSVLPIILGQRSGPVRLRDVGDLVAFLWKAYWLDFSTGGIFFADRWIYWIIGFIVVVGLAGVAPFIWQRGPLRVPLILLAAWFAVIFFSLLRLSIQTSTPMGGGRLLFPAGISLSALVAVGLAGLVDRKLRPVLPGIAAVATLAFAVLAVPFYLMPSAPQPVIASTVTTVPERRIDAQVGDAITLVGYTTHTSSDPEVVHVTFTWLSQTLAPANYSVFLQEIVHSPDGHDELLTQLDTYPSYGSAPTSFWRPGSYVVDQLDLPLRDASRALGPQQSILVISGLYDDQTTSRLKVGQVGSAGQILNGDTIVLGTVVREPSGRMVIKP